MTISKRAFVGLLAVFAVLYVLRMSGPLRPALVADHVSNFYLTGALVAVVVLVSARSRGEWN